MPSTSAVRHDSFAMDTLGTRRRANAQPSASTSVHSGVGAATVEEEPGPIKLAAKEWFDIQQELPPQITRRNIQMISVGGVIGTGLFLGISTSLSSGGPLGMVIGYIITGTIVYAVVISLSEMVSYIPNVGGPVGLADLYVDRALGFAMGWNAWYQWTIVLPAELSAAVVIASYYLGDMPSDPTDTNYSQNLKNYDKYLNILNYSATSILLVGAVAINCMTRYGQYEYYFATIKVCTIVVLIIIGIVMNNIPLLTTNIVPPPTVHYTEANTGSSNYTNLTCITNIFGNFTNTSKSTIKFKYYSCPGPFVQFQGIEGPKGKVLGIWSVLMQSIFSYCGSEIPGLAGAEVENPTKNIPSAVKRTWVRIFLFYVLGVFVAGLLVPYNHAGLVTTYTPTGTQFVQSSPFIIAMEAAGFKTLARIVTAFFLMSAWSAATSDIYISSRYMYFLAKRGHAPKFLSTLIPVGYAKEKPVRRRSESTPDTRTPAPPARETRLVVPIAGVVVAMIFAFLAYLPAQASNAQQVFLYVTTMTSAAAMLSWISIMVTYRVSWAEECDENFKKENPALYENRSFMQPYLAWYALVMCIAIITLHGWAVFTLGAVRQIALEENSKRPPADFVFIFITSYLPIPLFLLAIFGYKLVNQTSFVELHEMDFNRGKQLPEIEEDTPRGWLEWLF
ncbi:hypothetical protein FIBSPDRAFT_1053819 [Athelia psychrophila]|uniref:Amino acid permease/ SLC12A domain-containing protein n=1 Tax=Athelia psychrophila TaxID=1759441 RepID=A0A167WCT1_9AGAM|nr:hypothetical protein FIBSPDRAFT_1053819 [Fibularhizoctonia sp. CBS 109695]